MVDPDRVDWDDRLRHARKTGLVNEAATGAHPARDQAWERLEDQLAWYDGKSKHHKDFFQRLKVVQIVIAAAIPVGAAADAPVTFAAVLGSLILVLEGIQQLFQFQQNWITYRATHESLKHEKYLYLAEAGPYTGAERPLALLAERVEGLVSQEHAAWASGQQDAGGRRTDDKPS